MNGSALKKIARKIINRKAEVHYLSGLWLALTVYDKKASTVYIEINGQKIHSVNVKSSEPIDAHLCVQKVAMAIEGVESALIRVISQQTDQLLTKTEYSVADIYQKEFVYIAGSVNACISHIPLINKDSLQYLSDEQKVKIIGYIYTAKLQNDCVDTLTLLVAALEEVESDFSPELLEPFKYNQEVLALIMNSMAGKLQAHPLGQFIADSLTAMMYLDAKSLIEFSELTENEKDALIKACVLPDQEKFAFVERFPDTDVQGRALWNKLTTQQQKEYWPLLACAFEYKQQYQRLSSYPAPLNWFDENESQQRAVQVNNIITQGTTKWFALSIVLQEVQSDAPIDESINHLQEFVWANYSADFVNIDSFAFIVKTLLAKPISASQYEQLINVLVELFKSLKIKNENDLYRASFIALNAQIINFGIANRNWAFTKLGEAVRPYYALEADFLNKVNYQPLQQYDHHHYEYIDQVYGTSKQIIDFFAGLNANNLPEISLLRCIFNKLIYLRDNSIFFTEKWILSLSRFCQLNGLTELQPELAILHEKIEDYYGALILSAEMNDKLRLEKKIVESGKYVKRKDSYWFEKALIARKSNKLNVTLAYIEQLHAFLLLAEKNNHSINVDLLHLLNSELLWCIVNYSSNSELTKYIAPYFALLETEYEQGYTACQMAMKLMSNNTIALADLAALSKKHTSSMFTSLLSECRATPYTKEQQSELILNGLKQHYLYPYTQVMIYSCNAYKETRHKVIRDSWLPNLIDLGIDYCFVVGDANESHLDGDMMRLKVLDTYEELPHKSVEMFSFVAKNSHYRYHYKLDDDCVLNVHAMFADPAFLNTDYFGRVVERPMGGVDRSWHHQKSTTAYAKNTLDLSPEQSEYCDGSTGYILSHWAAKQLAEQAENQINIQLISASYFEDKLIGDLLANANIPSSDEGYNCVIRRKAALGRDLQMWDYGLLPTAQNNIKVLHTEDDHFRKEMGLKVSKQNAEIPALICRDISATTLSPRWLSDSEQAPILEKIKVDEKAIQTSATIAIIVGKNEKELLPNLLAHHRAIGIEHFLFVDNCSSDDSVDYMLAQPDVSVFIATQEYKHSRFGVNWQETLCSHYGLGRWVLIIDSDELYSYPDFETKKITTITEQAENEQATAIFSPMIDFYPKGALATADVTTKPPFYKTCNYFDGMESMTIQEAPVYGPFSNSIQYQGGLRLRIFGEYNVYPQPNYVNQKYNLLKYQPNMRLVEGLHFMHGHQLATEQCTIMHFKYHAGFHAKVVREIASGQHWNGATEYKRYANQLAKAPNASLFDNKLSKQYKNSSSLLKEIKG